MRNIWADCRDKYWLGAFAGNGKWDWEPAVVFMWLRCGIKTAAGCCGERRRPNQLRGVSSKSDLTVATRNFLQFRFVSPAPANRTNPRPYKG